MARFKGWSSTSKTKTKSKAVGNFGNKFTTVDDIKFHSKLESERYKILKSMVDKGKITNLQLQVKYLLVSEIIDGKKHTISYIADFVYELNGETIVEDVKGFKTQIYKMKRILMKNIHNITVKEVFKNGK